MKTYSKTCGTPRAASELETLTRAYARYSRSAGGLGSVLGGLLCLASYLVGGLLPLTPPVRAALIIMPLLWLGAKVWLSRNYYQRFGRVEEQETPNEHLVHRWSLILTIGVAAIITAVDVTDLFYHPGALSVGLAGYLIMLWLLPLATWRWMRSPMDVIIGVFLIYQAGMACSGQSYPVVGLTHSTAKGAVSFLMVVVLLAALAVIGAGIAQHRHFRGIRARLEAPPDAGE